MDGVKSAAELGFIRIKLGVADAEEYKSSFYSCQPFSLR